MDYGSPRREFFRLVMADSIQSLFAGNDAVKFFYMDSTTFKVCIAVVEVL